MKRIHALYLISLTATGFALIQLFTLVLASDQRQAGPSAVKFAPAAVFTVTNINNGGPGSLAQAILDANANPGADTITFSIGTGAQTINLTSALPSVSSPVTIDGTTQPGFSGAPIIELNGASAGGASSGLVILGGASTIKGLVINRFAGDGIRLASSGGNTIQGCYIGTDITGAVDMGNAQDGISVETANNIIGGSLLAARNIVSGNGRFGILITGISANGNAIKNNLIGTNKLGTMEVGNSSSGIQIQAGAKNNLVGGPMFGDGNIISGNDAHGIYITNTGSDTNTIQGNNIGTDLDGLLALGNSLTGVRIDTTGNVVGGMTSGARNVISGNKEYGLMIIGTTATDNHVIGNFIGVAASSFRLDFFANTACDPSTHGEGQTFLGSITVTTTAGCSASFTAVFAAAVVPGHFITATATGPSNSTSEFSACVQAACGYSISPASKMFKSRGSEASFNVTAPAVCNWTAVPSDDWIVITSSDSGSGSGTVSYLVRDNPTASTRQGAIIVAGQTHTIVQSGQAGGCSFTISPTFDSFGSAGGNGLINVTTGSGCPWEARSKDNWISITSGNNGSGSGLVTYTVAANPTATDRNGTIIVAGLVFNIKQQGCDQQSQQAKIIASDGLANDFLGYSTAISGNTLVIGDVNDDTFAGTDAGSVYVYVRDGANWVEQQKLFASDGAPFQLFGHSVAISGDTIVVGASGSVTGAGFSTGAVYVFVRQGNTWTEQQRLTASGGALSDQFGYSVAISGNTIVVGASTDDTGAGFDAGSVHVFVKVGDLWGFQQQLFAGDAANGDEFGTSVAVEGDRIVIGAYHNTTPSVFEAGSVYVFERAGAIWSQQAELFANDAATSDFFGWSVGLSGNTIVASAYRDDSVRGSVYVFEGGGFNWIQKAKLVADDRASDDRFGYSVAISGNRVVVGAYLADPFSIMNAGAAYIFDRNGTIWTQTQKLIANDAAANDEFGFSVSIGADSTIAVGARGVNASRGAAYVFAGCGFPLPFAERVSHISGRSAHAFVANRRPCSILFLV